jgi:hypothetical protein
MVAGTTPTFEYLVLVDGELTRCHDIGFRETPTDDKPDWNTKKEGIWNIETQQKIATGRCTKIDEVGVHYEGFVNPCIPLDGGGVELLVGDSVYVAIKNDVHPAKIVQIASTPEHQGCGVYTRRLSVIVDGETKKRPINTPSSVRKV